MDIPRPPTWTGLSTATLLLNRIPASDRAAFLHDLVASLNPDDQPGISFVASLLAQTPDAGVIQPFTEFLEEALRNGHVQSVVGICEQHREFGKMLLMRTVDVVQLASADHSFSVQVLRSYLQCSMSFGSRQPWSQDHSHLLDGCLGLLQSQSQGIHAAAKDAVLELLTMLQPLSIEDGGILSTRVWTTIQHLLNSTSNGNKLTAYSIWLRWLPTLQVEALQPIDRAEYYDFIRRGLRYGDTEQRKLCLNILKTPISTERDGIALSKHSTRQFDRFITVFDTVVLGRYINQVIECEADLNLFANGGEVESSWLYTLLGSALDNRMQDSNRKWIGNWVMRSGLSPSEEMLAFFRKDFLPWATQGQHFVATLKRMDGETVCRHGEQLANLIRCLRQDSMHSSAAIDIVVKSIMQKRNTMFAYCTVYLLQGLDRSLNDQQSKVIAALGGLPEVARDYVSLQVGSSSAPREDLAPTKKNIREQRTLEKMEAFKPTNESLEDIWTDVEYLEFPKRLLLALPATILTQETLEKAQGDPEFAASIRDKINILQGVARSKAFLFPPLLVALREAIMTAPKSVEFLDVESLIVHVAEHPPQPNIDLMLEEAIVKLTPYDYAHYFGERLSFGVAAYLNLISRLREHQDVVKTVLDKILSRWRSQKLPPPTVSAWKNTLQLQVLFLCCEQYQPGSPGESRELLESLFYILAIEPLPHYRYLMEAAIVQMIIRQGLHQDVIDRLQTKDHHSNPKHLASLMKMGGILSSASKASEPFAQQLMTTFVSLAASSKVVIRHEAQWQVPILMDHAKVQGWTSITDNTALIALDEYIRSLARFDDPPLERQVGKYDSATDCTLTNLVEGRWLELDPTETPLTTHADFAKLHLQTPLPTAPAPCIPLGPPILRPAKQPSQPPETSAPIRPATSSPDTTALQTKGTAHLTHPTTPSRNPDLLIIASLVDNPHNLGGLSRVSEIFGASALTLQNQNVLSNKDFLAVSVASHLHLPIRQLSAEGVPAYLRERKREGYTVVGIEQTDRSVILGGEGVVLPRRCCLVVGSEREGIPAGVLVECGMLVEIRQEGVTRSLNVQTAVGIALYEYGRQFGGGREG